jgi:ParB-like chromosome segregation protein Spo0J
MAKQTEKVVVVPICQIGIIEGFNDWRSEDEKTLQYLRESIKGIGQDTPVILRPHPDPHKRKVTPYHLVTGNRRMRAIIANAKEVKDHNPIIKAVIREMTEDEAIELSMMHDHLR